MNRRDVVAGSLIALVAVVSAATVAVIAIAPRQHDFHTIVNGQSGATFRVTLPASNNPQDSIRAEIGGADASEFAIEAGPGGGLAGTGPSSCDAKWRTGFCNYVVVFRPTSPGKKRANLGVVSIKGDIDMIPLTGDAVDGCRPLAVLCNYLELYEGVISSRTALATAGQNPSGRTGRWVGETTVTIARGTVWCQVGRDDAEQENNAGKPRTRSSESGMVVGAGLAAIEFRPVRGAFEYTLKYACPEPATTGTTIDYESNTSGPINTPGSPVKWSGQLAIDPHPVKAIGDPLTGKQITPYENIGSNDGVQGGTTTTWSLKRWR